jgi:hypothetical protein
MGKARTQPNPATTNPNDRRNMKTTELTDEEVAEIEGSVR